MKSGYEYKLIPELAWAAGMGLVVVLAEAFITFDETVFSDPRAWAVALVVSAVRSVGAAVLNGLRKVASG